MSKLLPTLLRFGEIAIIYMCSQFCNLTQRALMKVAEYLTPFDLHMLMWMGIKVISLFYMIFIGLCLCSVWPWWEWWRFSGAWKWVVISDDDIKLFSPTLFISQTSSISIWLLIGKDLILPAALDFLLLTNIHTHIYILLLFDLRVKWKI